MVAEVTVKCGTPQHYEIFSLYLRINHAQLLLTHIIGILRVRTFSAYIYSAAVGWLEQSHTLYTFLLRLFTT